MPPVPGLKSPLLWGTEARLRELFGEAMADLQVRKRHLVFRYRSPEAYLDYWRHWYGPTLKAFEAVGPDGEDASDTKCKKENAPHVTSASFRAISMRWGKPGP